MEKKLSKHQAHLKTFNKQRKGWLVLSALVVVAVCDIIFNWSFVTGNYMIWTFTSCGFIVAVVWWYWTMRLIRQLIDHRVEEAEILHDIVLDLKEIKKEVKETMSNIIDRSK
jgi:membrane protein YdbS with pleckstrin-like domain